MRAQSLDPLLGMIRKITPEEVAFYRANGWVKLEKVIPAELTKRLRDIAQGHMGVDAEDPRFSSRGARYAAWPNSAAEDEWLYQLSHSPQLCSIASSLTGGRPLRWYTDIFMAKRSAGAGGTKTPWHQDLPHQAFDRGGALSLWIPLVDCPPEKGAMRFLSGSHRAGPLGRFATRTDGIDIVAFYPDLLDEFEMSPPLHLEVGDATVHDFLTVHSAPDNLTDTTRWVYGVTWFPAETLYNGAFSMHTSGMELDKEFDDKRFPIIPV